MKTLSILSPVAFIIALAPMAHCDESSPMKPNAKGQINLVAVGEAIYIQHCYICHEKLPTSDPKSQPKIGPSFFGLLQKKPIKKTVFSKENLTDTLTEVLIDDHYIRSSLLEPTLHIAAKKEGAKFVAYPPGMPRFPLKGIEFKGISAYLRTLNDDANKGPNELWHKAPKTDLKDSKHEVTVGSKTKVVRAVFGDSSTRAIAVGSPSGLHYIFDPAFLSIRKVWKGGFVNLKAERTARSKGINPLGKNAKPINFGDTIRPLAGTAPVDSSYQSFPSDSHTTFATLEKDIIDTAPYLERIPQHIDFLGYRIDKQSNPEFHYKIGNTEYRQKVESLTPETMKLKFTFSGATKPIRFKVDIAHVRIEHSIGTLNGDILSIPAATKSAILTLHRIK